MDALAGALRAEDAVRGARESLATMEATYAFWMTQYERQTRDVAVWVDAHATDTAADETAPRFQLLLRALEPTRHGLDCAVQSLGQAQHRLVTANEELHRARQFLLEEGKASDVVVKSNPAVTPDALQPRAVSQVVTKDGYAKRSRKDTQPVSAAGLLQSTRQGRATEESSRVPSTREYCPRTFTWSRDSDLHLFPEDFDMPRCSLAEIWQAWCCGGPDGSYPPLRVMETQDLTTRRVRNRFSDLRIAMTWIEEKVRARGSWPDDDVVGHHAAAEMFDRVKDGIGTSRSTRERQMQPVENLMWTTAVNIVRKQKFQEHAMVKMQIQESPSKEPAMTPTNLHLQSPAIKRQRRDSSANQSPPTTRVRCPRNFVWARDSMPHYFPEDFQVPNGSIVDMWKLWCCGDDPQKLLPLRLLMARDLTLPRAKSSFANFRRVMDWVEGLVRAKGFWVAEVRPTAERACVMFDAVRADIESLRGAHGKRAKPLENTKCSGFERLLQLERTKKG